jgi:MFS superfamily sulfate permease-like transporter
MKNSFIINQMPKPRKKETYTVDEPMTFLLSDRFQEKIHDLIEIDIRKSGTTKFPLSGSTSIYLDLYTDRKISILGVQKNVMDSLNRLVVTDDSKVQSSITNRYPSVNGKEHLILSVLSNRLVSEEADMKEIIDSYGLFTIRIDGYLESRYLPYSLDKDIREIAEVNKTSDKKLAETILKKHNMPTVTDRNISMKLEFFVNDYDVDIDNLALEIVYNCKNVIFASVSQIDNLIIVKQQCRINENPFFKVSWE